MTSILPLRCCIATALLLQACAAPAPRPLQMQPNLQVRHSTNETAEAYYQMGRRHHTQGNVELALIGYTYAAARDPRHIEARSAAASIHAQQGRLDQARAMLLAVVADFPGEAQGHNNLGYLDYLRGEHVAAAQSMRRALAIDPSNQRARNNLRLAEAALPSAMTAVLAAPAARAEPAPPLVAAADPAPVQVRRAPQVELVQVVPNVYELKMPPPAAAIAQVRLAKSAPPARMEVANGDGAAGLARRVGALLGKHGMAVARLSNEKPFGQRATRIEYRAGYAAQAEAVRLVIGGAAVLSQAGGGADVRVVLGQDSRKAMALRDAQAASVRIAAR